MDDCFRAHPLLHIVTGVGIGMLLLVLFPDLMEMGLTLGLIALLAGVIGEVVFLGGKSMSSSKKRR